jgi:hypothetical protein
MSSQDPTAPGRRPKRSTAYPEMPVLVQPVPKSRWPKAIKTVRVLTVMQVVLVMLCGNCSFGWTLVAGFGWLANYFGLTADPLGFGIYSAWAVGFAAIVTYAIFTDRWTVRADRRARTTIIIGTAVLVSFTAAAIAIWKWNGDDITAAILLAAAPPLIIQAIALRCVFGHEGRRWFASSEADRMDGSA